ncbi:hypothetical protein F4677DRAFT_415290 [Hypoxylon crocopeplum]|nr:hypothetical protein F4677DRAFT_415290 [Hypoxylon crocopeplum]
MSTLRASAHPVYSGTALPWQERYFQSGRKYGKYDFGRFERLEGSGHYLGKGRIGDVEVACKFLFRESRWGVLTHEKNPGGVVYLDLTFTKPAGCRLRDAVVQLTLDEEDEDLQRQFGAQDPPMKAKVPVQIIAHGPQSLLGQVDEAFKVTRHFFAPSIDVGGFAGAGGVGRDSEKQSVQRSQWKFSSTPVPTRSAKATVLKWHLVESELDRQPKHANTFHTAFAFEHDGQPFLMQVEVSGSLERITSRLRQKAKQRFKKFRFPVDPQIATTLVNFGGRNNPFQNPLDELARRIPLEMVEKNTKLAMQMPERSSNSRPFYELIEEEEPATNNEDNQHSQPLLPQREDASGLDINDIMGEAMALMPLERSSKSPFGQAGMRETRSLVPNQHREAFNRSLSTIHNHGRPLTTSNMAVDREQDEVDREVSQARSHLQQDELRKFLEDAGLPTMIQLIILWIAAVGLKMSPPSKMNILPRSEGI